MKLYAVNALMYRPIRPPDDSTSLQEKENLNTVEQLALYWQARFNSGKYEHIRIIPILKTQFSLLIATIQNTIPFN